MDVWKRQIKLAQYMLLGTVIITVINVAFLLGNVDMFVSYCASLPYYLVWLGKLFDNGYFLGPKNGEFVATGMIMAGILLAGYLVIWWLARGNRRWLKVSLWVIVADLAALILIAITLFADPTSCFWEAVIHIAVIWEISQGLKAYKQQDAALQRAREAEDLQQAQAAEALQQEQAPQEDALAPEERAEAEEQEEAQEECPL